MQIDEGAPAEVVGDLRCDSADIYSAVYQRLQHTRATSNALLLLIAVSTAVENDTRRNS